MDYQETTIANKKILVTGCAGFIGYHVTTSLLKRGASVVGLDNISDYYDVNLKYARLNELGVGKENVLDDKPTESEIFDQFTFFKADLINKNLLLDLFRDFQFDIVVNLAAQAGVRYSVENPDVYIDSNIHGFFNILEACRHSKISHLVYASSSSVYGANKTMPFSEHDKTDQPLSLYAASKKSNELMAYTYSHLFNISTTGLRFFTVYGPWGRPDMAIYLFANAINADKKINVYNHGDMQRDFTYVDDIVEGINRVIGQAPEARNGQPPYALFNIGNNKPAQLMDYISYLEDAFGKKVEKNFLPIQPGDLKSTYADVSLLKEKFDYHPKTDIKSGIQAFADWYKQYHQT